MRLKHESEFKVEDYEDFYSHHFFQPVSDSDAVQAHRIFPRVAWALDVANETKPKSVLDLGCLEGYTALTLANKVKSVERAVGVDLSEEAITLAKNRTDMVKGNVEFFVDSIEKWLENCDEKFHLITNFEVMEHVKDPQLVIKLMDKVLAPNGTILISTPAFESPTYGKDDEQNKCHIRLYTTADEDYREENKYGTLRKATSIFKEIGYGSAERGHERAVEYDVVSELINLRYN